MSIRRVVPDIKSQRFDESTDFYVGLLGFEVAMDTEWIMTFASPTNPTAQVSIMKRDATANIDPELVKWSDTGRCKNLVCDHAAALSSVG